MALNVIGSGLDIPTLVSQLVAAERAPTAKRINDVGSATTAKLSALGTIKSSLSSLQGALGSLGKSAGVPSYKATVPDGAGFTASTSDGSIQGSYQVEVVSLSQAQKLTSGAFQKDQSIGEGSLTLEWGDTSIDVQISAAHKLEDIAKDINAAAGGKGVTASVITADDGQHLVLNAVNGGKDGAIKVSATGTGLSALTWDGAAGGLNQTVEATDAVVRVDGFERTSSSNSIADLIPGVTLTLTKAAEGTKTTLTVSQDNSPLKTSLQAFITAYNATNNVLKSSSAYNATSNSAAALTGDSMVRGLQQQLRNLVSSNVADLKTLGVSIATDGTLSLDSGAFDKALAADPVAANVLFGTEGKLTSSLNTILESQLDSSTGTLIQRTETLNKQIKKLEKDLDDLDLRMEKVSKRYTAQFTAMDKLVAQMQSTSDYLTQQLASLSNMTKSS